MSTIIKKGDIVTAIDSVSGLYLTSGSNYIVQEIDHKNRCFNIIDNLYSEHSFSFANAHKFFKEFTEGFVEYKPLSNTNENKLKPKTMTDSFKFVIMDMSENKSLNFIFNHGG